MARILPLVGVLESTPFYHRAWLFEPVFFLPGTAGTTACAVIPPAPSLCQAGMGGSVSSCWQKSSYSEWSHCQKQSLMRLTDQILNGLADFCTIISEILYNN